MAGEENTESGWSPLVDVSEMSLSDLITPDNSALSLCLERLVRGLDDPDGIISAFQNFAS